MKKVLSRRAALAGIAALAPAVDAAHTVNAKGAHPDAALFVLDRKIDALLAEFEAHDAMGDDFSSPVWRKLIKEHPKERDIEAWHRDQIHERFAAAVEKIMAKQPRTLEGLAVMARTWLLDAERTGIQDYAGPTEIQAEQLCLALLTFCGAEPRKYKFS